jgi:hypothetical protein
MNPAHGGTNWIPGLMMLGAGAVAALAFLFASKRIKGEGPSTGSFEDLNTRYQAKLGALKDHRAQKHLLDATEWDATRLRLEQEAAAILRERDGVKHEKRKAQGRAETKAAAKAKDASLTAKNPTLTWVAIGATVVGFFVLLGFNLSSAATDRTDGMSVTGATPPGGGAGPMQQQAEREDPRVIALARRVEASPEDPDALADLALTLLLRQSFDEARVYTGRVGMLDPFHVRGRVARAVMRAVDGEVAPAVDDLEHLAAYYPEAYEGRLFAGLITMEENPARAAANLEAYAATAPQAEQPPMVGMMIQQARQLMAGKP